tara:strand:+ start:424 stop:678 length:255 start_codon:yes stop_codon:yes gene_type:complete
MQHEVVVPELDLDGASLSLSGWLVKSGVQVVPGDPICEVCAGDIVVEVGARYEGIFQRESLEVDQQLQTGMRIGLIEQPEAGDF